MSVNAWFRQSPFRWSHFSGKRVERGRGAGVPYEPLPESLQRIMEDLDYQI
jgi:hypothetical protein